MRRALSLWLFLATLLPPLALEAEQSPVVVELFTSHGCSSCPPADALLGELVNEPGILALEWHVDYWDKLSVGPRGAWKDPWSLREATQRQLAYNLSITGKQRNYTPQAVIGGRKEMVGSNERQVRQTIRRLREERPALHLSANLSGEDLEIDFTPLESGALKSALPQKANLWLILFKESAITRIMAGENDGLTVKNNHIVLASRKLGSVSTSEAFSKTYEGLQLSGDLNCAVLLQELNLGPILAAAPCLLHGDS